MNLDPTRRVSRLLLATAFVATTLLTMAMPALAKHGGNDHGRDGFDGEHDHGRHLGWYKHGGPVFGEPVYPNRRIIVREEAPFYGGWVGRRAWGGGAWGWQSNVIAASAAWSLSWGFGASYAFYAPPVIFVPPPTYLLVPPVVVSVPWTDAPSPYYAPPPAYAATPGHGPLVAVAAPADVDQPPPEAMLLAALPPPVLVLPPREVLIAAAPPPVIFSPPAYALSVWPALAFTPPMLAFAVLHDEWWTTRYLGRGGYYGGGYYASPSYAGGLYATTAIAAAGLTGADYARRRETYFTPVGPVLGFRPGHPRGYGAEFASPFGGHGHGWGGGGHRGHGHGH